MSKRMPARFGVELEFAEAARMISMTRSPH
jgi:hypothetical protein